MLALRWEIQGKRAWLYVGTINEAVAWFAQSNGKGKQWSGDCYLPGIGQPRRSYLPLTELQAFYEREIIEWFGRALMPTSDSATVGAA